MSHVSRTGFLVLGHMENPMGNGFHRLIAKLRNKVTDVTSALETERKQYEAVIASLDEDIRKMKVFGLRMRDINRELKKERDALRAELYKLKREKSGLEIDPGSSKLLVERSGKIALLEQQVRRLRAAIAARDCWEGCEVVSPAGTGTIISVGETIDVLLETGHVWRGTSLEDLKRKTAPDPDRARELRLLLEELREDGALADQPITGDVELLYYGPVASAEELN